MPAKVKGFTAMDHNRVLAILALTAGLLVTSAAVAETQLSGTGTVEYRLVHKFHKITGVSKAMAVRGTVDGSGLKVMARTQVSTFDSDNTNRDAHMMETVEGEKYPWATVRASLPGFTLPANGTKKVTVQASVELHGVSVIHPIELTIETKDGKVFHVSFEFSESLTAHKIERPSLLFVPVDDEIKIEGHADVTAKS
jgi:YceI-like domain